MGKNFLKSNTISLLNSTTTDNFIGGGGFGRVTTNIPGENFDNDGTFLCTTSTSNYYNASEILN